MKPPKFTDGFRDYRKKVPQRQALTAREAVTIWGDDWRLLGNTPYAWSDRCTPDDRDAASMRMMERGEMGRITL